MEGHTNRILGFSVDVRSQELTSCTVTTPKVFVWGEGGNQAAFQTQTQNRSILATQVFSAPKSHDRNPLAISALTEPDRQNSRRKKGIWAQKLQPQVANR